MKIIKILSIIGLLLVAFISNAQNPQFIKTNTFEGVIFPVIPGTSPENAKKSFMPSVKEIIKMEKKIADSIGVLLSTYEKHIKLREYPDGTVKHCDFAENLQQFKRQYTGVQINGEMVIVAFFFRNVPESWKKEMYTPAFSNKCDEFHLSYSVKSGKLFNFFTDLSRM
jgi:hypothetical protein